MRSKNFSIFDECCAYVGRELLCILLKHDVVECNIIDGFAFAVCIDIRWESVHFSQVIGHLITNPSYKEYLSVMV